MRCSEPNVQTPKKEAPKKAKLAPKAADFLSERIEGLPVWIRPPKVGREHFTALTRPYLYQLAGEGKIRSVSIREPGKMTGVRLFHLASILAFIEQCERAPQTESAVAA